MVGHIGDDLDIAGAVEGLVGIRVKIVPEIGFGPVGEKLFRARREEKAVGQIQHGGRGVPDDFTGRGDLPDSGV